MGIVASHLSLEPPTPPALRDGLDERAHPTTTHASTTEVERQSREETIVSFTRVWTAGGGLDRTCAVCLDTMQAGETLMTLPCFHVFHRHCATDWLMRNDDLACPECNGHILAAARSCGGPSNKFFA